MSEKMTIEQIALDIADESEASLIESVFLVHIVDGVKWYNTRPSEDSELITRAQAYLTLRGLLIRHKDRPELIRVLNASDLGQRATELLGQS